jgi:hypothetical protein
VWYSLYAQYPDQTSTTLPNILTDFSEFSSGSPLPHYCNSAGIELLKILIPLCSSPSHKMAAISGYGRNKLIKVIPAPLLKVKHYAMHINRYVAIT